MGVFALREKLSAPNPPLPLLRLGVFCDGDFKFWPSTGSAGDDVMRLLLFSRPPNERLRTSDEDFFDGVSRENMVM